MFIRSFNEKISDIICSEKNVLTHNHNHHSHHTDHSSKSRSRNSNEPRESIILLRRNCVTDNLLIQIDESKGQELNNKRLELYHYLSKIKQAKKLMNNTTQLTQHQKEVNRLSRIKKMVKKQNSNYYQRHQVIKMKKKSNKKKEKKFRPNFLINNWYKKHMIIERYDIDYVDNIRDYKSYMLNKLRSKLPLWSGYMQCLINSVKSLLKLETKCDLGRSINDNQLMLLVNYQGEEIKTIQMEESKEEIEINTKGQRLLNRKKKFCSQLEQNEGKYYFCKIDTEVILSEAQECQMAVETKKYFSRSIIELSPSLRRRHKDYNRQSKEEIAIDNKKKQQLKERVINYTLKTFDLFNFNRVIQYWMNNCDKLKEKKIKDPYYKNQPLKWQMQQKQITTDNKKKTKVLKIKEIYSTPNNDIKFLIPYCTKKYTIQKLDK